MKIVLFLIILFFALFGFSEFLHLIKLKIIFPKRKMYTCLVVNLQNTTAQQQLAFVCEQFCWYGDKFAERLVINCKNLDDDTYLKCQGIARKYNMKLER